MTDPVKTEIEREGQAYVDKPVHAEFVKGLVSPMAVSLAEAWGNVMRFKDAAGMAHVRRRDLPNPPVLHYQRTALRWMRPRRGRLIPK